jgi:hypothetical protein
MVFAQSDSSISKELQPLYNEARKYKSADDFIDSKGSFIHETNANKFDKFDISKVGDGQ